MCLKAESSPNKRGGASIGDVLLIETLGYVVVMQREGLADGAPQSFFWYEAQPILVFWYDNDKDLERQIFAALNSYTEFGDKPELSISSRVPKWTSYTPLVSRNSSIHWNYHKFASVLGLLGPC